MCSETFVSDPTALSSSVSHLDRVSLNLALNGLQTYKSLATRVLTDTMASKYCVSVFITDYHSVCTPQIDMLPLTNAQLASSNLKPSSSM